MSATLLLALAGIFAELSLVAFGGANAILPEMQRQVVDVHGWMSATDFTALFALAQTAPGPNLMIVTLIGWRVAALPGALVATLAQTLPAACLTGIVSTLWHRYRGSPWRLRIQAALVPIMVGLVAASAVLITRIADADWRLGIITAVVAVVFATRRMHPLWLLCFGGACGLLGLV